MHSLAKAYKKKHPNAKYSTALKEAGRKVRGKVSGHKAAKKSSKKKVGSHYVVRHSVKRVGAIHVQMPSPSQLESKLKEQLAWELLARETAKNVRDRKAASAQIKKIKTTIRAVSGLKRK